jgi:hypothetical protein
MSGTRHPRLGQAEQAASAVARVEGDGISGTAWIPLIALVG